MRRHHAETEPKIFEHTDELVFIETWAILYYLCRFYDHYLRSLRTVGTYHFVQLKIAINITGTV